MPFLLSRIKAGHQKRFQMLKSYIINHKFMVKGKDWLCKVAELKLQYYIVLKILLNVVFAMNFKENV